MTQAARPPFATMNGCIVPFEKATVSIMAPGLTFSVLAFEGLRGYWNSAHEQLYVFRAPEHMARLAFSSRVIEIDGFQVQRNFIAFPEPMGSTVRVGSQL